MNLTLVFSLPPPTTPPTTPPLSLTMKKLLITRCLLFCAVMYFTVRLLINSWGETKSIQKNISDEDNTPNFATKTDESGLYPFSSYSSTMIPNKDGSNRSEQHDDKEEEEEEEEEVATIPTTAIKKKDDDMRDDDETRNFTIVILTMNRLKSVQRLVESLNHEDCNYGSDKVNLVFHIDRPKQGKSTSTWMKTIQWTNQNVSWPYGQVTSLVAKENMGLRDAWFNAWKPKSDDDRAIILEDDIELSPLWYRWVHGAYDAYNYYNQYGNVAGFSLQRQQLVPVKDGRQKGSKVPINDHIPFLYPLIGSIGFAPLPKVWRDFVEWTKCALCNDVDVSVPSLKTSNWWKRGNKRAMWTQHMIYYMYHNDLYCLYQIPKNGRALSVHWKEKGEHFKGNIGKADFPKVTNADEIGDLVFPEHPALYNWGALPVNETSNVARRAKTLIISAAVGYKDPSQYTGFVSSLRRYYEGDVMLLIAEEASSDVKEMLHKNKIGTKQVSDQVHSTTRGANDWFLFNRDRFQF